MKSDFLTQLRELSYSKNSSCGFNARTKDNLSLVQRLKLVDSHRVHRGCVNTIAWDDSGNYILSGSDDLSLVVLDPFNGKVALSYKTKHPTNIFCAKFLPQSQNEQVVSSSAAGHIFHTRFDRQDRGISCGFNCHTGAAYELATIPNDPFVFMSCGEDRTIRWFDLRIKSSCNKEECSEDVLVNCSRPIMSMSLHPSRPFEFAAGCSDSTVRIFDRRFICPNNNGRMLRESCFLKFACPLLDNHHHRITSLLYGSDGTELLVSYSSEHLYLFDFKKDGRKFKSMLKTPLKLSSEPSMMFSPDSMKASSSSPSSPQSSSSSSPSPPSEQVQPKGKAAHGTPLMTGVSKQLPIKRLRLRGDWSDTGPQARPKKERPTGEQSSGVASVMERMSNLMTRWLERNLVRDSNEDEVITSNEVDNMEDDGDDDNDDNGDDDDGNDQNICLTPGHEGQLSLQEQNMQIDNNKSFEDVSSTSESANSTSVQVQEEPIVKVFHKRQDNPAFNKFDNTARRYDQNFFVADSGEDRIDERRAETSNQERDESTISNAHHSNVSPCGDVICEQQQHNTTKSAGPSRPTIFISPASTSSINNEQTQDQTQDQPSESIRDKAAKTLQAFFSSKFKSTGKDDKMSRGKRDDNDDDRSNDDDDSQDCDASYRPAVTKCYKGHRNSRTLIKEASFWGSKYVMSGSDCGHIFIWDKNTTELVMFLEGDNHVVNCLQPHPSLPVLASSGIDYDVKIWMPSSEYSAFNKTEAYQVMNRNEVMLEETKGTVTVPAEFMFRLFSSLSRIRRGGNRLPFSRNIGSLD